MLSPPAERASRRRADALAAHLRRPGVVRVAPALVVAAIAGAQVARNQPLWYDEAYSALAARVPLSTLLAGVWHRTGLTSYLSTVPPSFNAPYYVLLHVWGLLLGTTALALRIPSVLCAAAAVGVVAEVGRRLAGPGVGLLTGLLCATGPLLLDEAAQARDYGPALLALSICALHLVRFRTDGRHVGAVAGAAGAAGLLHWFTLPVLAGFLIVGCWGTGRAGRRLAIVTGLALLPALALVGWSVTGGTPGAPTPTAVGLDLPLDAVRDWAAGFLPLAVALGVAAAAGLTRSRARRWVVGWAVVPIVLITAVELLRPTYFARYLLFALVGVMLAAVLGVAGLRSRQLRLSLAAVLIALSIAAEVPQVGRAVTEPSVAAVRYLAERQTAGQPIVTADGRVALDLLTNLTGAQRLQADLVLPPAQTSFRTQSTTVWLVRVVLKANSVPVMPAEQHLADTGWTRVDTVLLVGSGVDLRIEKWTKA